MLPIWGAAGLALYYLYGYRTSHVGKGLIEVHEDDLEPHTPIS